MRPKHSVLSRSGRCDRRRGHLAHGVSATVAAAAVVVLAATTSAASWAQQHATVDGKVVRVVDGDTVTVDVWGDGITTPQPIRNAGIQAMEVGQCHSGPASAAMAALVAGRHVRLSAKYAASSSLGRPVRFLDVITSRGPVDPQLSLLASGQALPLVIPPETGRWKAYFTAAQKAAAARKNLWDTSYCKAGPAQLTPIRLWVNYDADGDDNKVVNGEYVRILNQGSVALHVGGWWVRTAAQDSFRFPAGAVVQPHATVTLYVGKGVASATRFYWGNTVPRFPNIELPGAYGSGAYLFDPDGDVRAHATYPCLFACTDVRSGQLHLLVNYDAPGDDMTNPNGEYVDITSSATRTVDLSHTVLSIHGNVREFGSGTFIAPGERLRTYVGTGGNSRLTHHWGKPSALFPNAGGVLVLRTTEGWRLACRSWGNGAC